MAPVLASVQRAVKAGCKVVCVTVGAPYRSSTATLRSSWAAVDQVRQAATVPVVLKGIMNAQDAHAAVDKNISGIIVSNNGGMFTPGLASAMEGHENPFSVFRERYA